MDARFLMKAVTCIHDYTPAAEPVPTTDQQSQQQPPQETQQQPNVATAVHEEMPPPSATSPTSPEAQVKELRASSSDLQAPPPEQMILKGNWRDCHMVQKHLRSCGAVTTATIDGLATKVR